MLLLLINIATASSHYHHFASWETKPKIIICESKNITKKNVDDALSYWRPLGYEFNIVEKKEKCTFKKLGEIIITEKYFEDEQGLTSIKTYKYMDDTRSNYIDYATIQINQKIELYTG